MEISIISLESRKGTKLGEERKVRRGYARYLIRNQKALPYTKADVAQFSQMRAELEKQEAQKREEAQAKAEKLKALPIQLHSRAADAKRLYGSIGAKEIAAFITAEGIAVDKTAIEVKGGAIRELGEHPVVIHLHDQVAVEVMVHIAPPTA